MIFCNAAAVIIPAIYLITGGSVGLDLVFIALSLWHLMNVCWYAVDPVKITPSIKWSLDHLKSFSNRSRDFWRHLFYCFVYSTLFIQIRQPVIYLPVALGRECLTIIELTLVILALYIFQVRSYIKPRPSVGQSLRSDS